MAHLRKLLSMVQHVLSRASLMLLLVAATACSKSDLLAKICTPGAVRCTAHSAEVCNDAGTAWTPAPCPQGQACVRGDCGDPSQCPDACKDIVCTPGSYYCDSSHVFLMQCDDTGTGGCAVRSCASPPLDGVCYNGGCVAVCSAQQKTYIGCEYYATDLDNAHVPCSGDPNGQFCDAANAQYAVVVSNPDVTRSAYVVISNGPVGQPDFTSSCVHTPKPPQNFVAAASVAPASLHIFDLPSRNINGTELARLAYRVASNIPITVYQFNPLENVGVFSNDASLLMPTTAAGSSYYVMSRQELTDSLRGFLTVVGIRDQPTQVTVKVTADTGAGPGIAAMSPGDSITRTLDKYDVLNIETGAPGADLTGSTVSADAPVVVYGGHEAANVPDSVCDLTTNTCKFDHSIPCGCAPGAGADCNPNLPCLSVGICCADHLEQQLFPVSTWGREYLAVRSWPRHQVKDAWRILAAEDGTTVTLAPAVATVPTLNAGKYFDFEAAGDFQIHASAPVMVGQFLESQDAPNPGAQPGDAGTGDPAFILAVPIRQFRKTYVFLAPNKYADDYVSIGAKAGSSVSLDGTEAALAPLAEVAPVGSSQWMAIRVPIADGYHTLECSQPCSVMVHGYDQYVSYGYPGGLNLFECSTDADCPVERPHCNTHFACVTP